ncbi:hypothetical protein [Yinghuangia seranimata]|uniref:hypothetical protein n=1 Tax=Yinghuangia seranimata TaxID=408067 RepID=UPI00248A985D|nr:hypothetical protein [Yinghuangia seranimata]MDI2126329.1 hypothetical protein [Yinghuangia seranimata]
MQPRLEATLADFVPALRFLSPESVDRHLGHPDLPPAWWTGVPIARAVDAIGAAELPSRLADLAYAELRHLRLGDLLPAAWLARNDFRLSQWPDGVRTSVLVRTPDWGDLLGATVQEIGDWTQIGTSTVRPVIAQLFAEVLGLLPAEGAGAPEEPDAVAEDSAAEDPTAADAADADDAPDEGEAAALQADAADRPRGIRIAKRRPAEAAQDSAFALPATDADDSAADREAFADTAPGGADTSSTELEPVSDLLDAIEDELRPVSMPAPPTGDLGAVVRWLAEEAPDVPLMSELARVTLETVAVVGVEGAPPEVRTAVLRLTSLVPETLLPEGLDVSEDAFEVPGADLEDPYDAPEMTVMLAGVPDPVETFEPEAPKAEVRPEPEHEPASARDKAAAREAYLEGDDEAHEDFAPVYEPDFTGATPTPPSVRAVPAPVGAEDMTVLAMPAAREPEPADTPDPVDAFGEIPPATREDSAVRVPEAEEPAQPVDAFGEIPPLTRDDVPVQRRDLEREAEATVFEPPAAATQVAGTPPWAGADDVTVEVGKAEPAEDRVPAAKAAEPEAEAAASPAEGVVYPPKPSSPPPIPPMPSTPPPAPEAEREPDPEPDDIVMVLAALFRGREPRWRMLARDRMFTDTPRDTASVAAEFGKSDAEVEALERALKRHLYDQLEQPVGARVRDHLGFVQARLGSVSTVTELLALDERHTDTVPGLGVQVWQVVRGLLNLHTSADGWLTAGAPGELASRTSEVVGGACEQSGTVPLAALKEPLLGLGIRAEVQEAWIGRMEGFEVVDGTVRLWPAPAAAPAADEPVDADAATVEVTPEPVSTDPGDAAQCFRDDQGVWWYRVDVDTPLLDGERLPLPPAFVSALGLRPGQSLRLHHAAGPAALRWEDRPYCVSLRTVLNGIAAEDGDMVFIGSVRPGRLETRLLAGDGKLRLPRWARALRHTGVDPVPDQVNLPSLLGARLGLAEGCDLKAVLKRLQDRGDSDVLELLGVAPAR